MEKAEFTQQKTKKIWISLTGYRILLILRSLMQKGQSIEELIEILQKNSFTNKCVSKDTIRLAINTLKKAGCQITRPCRANNYEYQLISHPFTFNLNDKELKTLIRLRNKMAEEMDWESIFDLNEVYKKIVSLTFNKEQIHKIEESKPLLNINKEIIKAISNPQIIGKKIKIIYDSPEFKEEELDIIPQKITFENGNIYLWCYSFKYRINSLLNIERIKKLISIDISKTIETTSIYDVTYTITGNSIKTFEPKEFEEVLERTEKFIKVLAHVENEFYFIQRILLLGSDFKIVSPNFFKEKLINKIKLIQKGYDNETV